MLTGNLTYGMTYNANRQLIIQRLANKGLLTPLAQASLQTNVNNDSPPLKARVNHGRWIVDCECNSAELAFDEGLFMCQTCWNAAHSNQLRRFVFPGNRLKIEAILMMRPDLNRNWYVGETLTKLEAENKAHKNELLGVK